MRVRVYDKATNKYLVSEVYAIINSGYYAKYLILEHKEMDKFFCFYEYLDKSIKTAHLPVNINIISCDELPEPWIVRAESDIRTLNKFNVNDKYNGLFEYRGYEFVFKQTDLLNKLLKGHKVRYEELRGNEKELSSTLMDWNYVNSNEDINNLMNKFHSFHDSVLKSLSYISGAGKVDNGMSVTDYLRQVTILFDSDWSDSIEIVFEGVLALNLRPAKDNYSSDLYSATIILKDETIIFFDSDYVSDMKDYEGTCINSLGMRWRFIKS